MDITADDLGELVVYFGSPAQMIGGTDWAEIVDQRTYLTSSVDGTYKFGMTMFLGGEADGDWKLFVRRRSGDPIVVHGWEVVVYGHGTSSAASGSGVDDSGQLDSSREMSCGRTLDARTAYAVTNSGRPPAAPSGLQPSDPWSWTDPRPVAAGAGPQYLYSGTRRFRTSSDWWWSTPTLMQTIPGTGTPPPTGPDPDPDPDPEPPPPEPEPVCPVRVTPYWHGTGGFAVRPSDGESAMFRIECAGREYESREYAGEDGLIVRTVSQPMCRAGDGRPIEGEMTFEGIDGDGWYWVNGDRNVAVAPLVCELSLNPELRPPMPVGVTARPTGDRRFVLSVRGTWHGTLMVHDETGFMGIVPHLVDLEGQGEHVAPYWKGGGGIVGRPLEGSRALVRLACGEANAESQVLDAGGDGLIVALLPGCFDEEGAALRGRLEADGLEDGAWYWLNTGTSSAAAPLLRRGADVDLTTPVLPGGVDAEEGPLGTLFSRGPLLGVVPRVERVENE
ncbi:MAG: hypothetical protein OXG81_08015 [Acidobacteria bacterium]|nr:hypothetical protein [Acidobacteriota bacterium]